MGYLVNPTAMRIGWFTNWTTNYYTDHRYYGEQLYLVLRLRLYITSVVEEPEWIIHKWIYSHVRIHKGYWGYQAQVYYYDGIMYDSWYECIGYIDTFARRISGYKQYVYTGKWEHEPRMQNQVMMDLLLMLIIVRLFTTIKNPMIVTPSGRGGGSRWYRGLPLLGVAIFNQLAGNPRKQCGGGITRLSLFYSLIQTITQRKASVSTHLNKIRGTSLRAIFGGYYRLYTIYYHTKPWLTVHSQLLGVIFTSMHNTNTDIQVNYYLIDNKQVTANFLTTYIGWRLRQNYSLGMLLNPLQRELHRVMRVWRRTHKVGRHTRNSQVKQINELHNRYYLLHLFTNYHILYKELYMATASWLNMDTVITQYVVAQHLCSNKWEQYLNSSSVRATYYGICRIAMSRRGHILFFLKATQSRLYAYHLFTPATKLGGTGDNYLWARAMYSDITCNYVHIADKEQGRLGGAKIYNLPVWPAIRIGAWGLARYHDYIQYITHKGRYHCNFKISKGSIMRKRVREQSHIRGLLGFKIQLKGRFSRKQIAAKSIKDYGKMPLNTLNAHIEYAFRTVAIKNSAIGVKVWLYRGNYALTNLYNLRTS